MRRRQLGPGWVGEWQVASRERRPSRAGDLKALGGGVDEAAGFVAGEEVGPEMEKEGIRKWKN